jgi:hypothetical protein
MIRIEHTHADGTLVHGTARGDGSRDVLREFGLRWGRSLGCWFVPQSRDRDARTGYRGLEVLKDALEGAGFTVELSIDNTRRATADVQADRLERAADRAEALDDRAARLAREAAGHSDRAHAATAQIPFGQPILVGHHSERRHRAAIARSDSAMRRSIETRREAEGAANGAAAARATVARANDPLYVQNRLDEAEAELRSAQRGSRTIEPPYRAVVSPSRVARAQEQVDYWRGEMERIQATGRKVYTKADIAVGDAVRIRHGWCKVVRCNPKTVACDVGMPRPLKYKYAEIRGHKTAAALEAAATKTETEG